MFLWRMLNKIIILSLRCYLIWMGKKNQWKESLDSWRKILILSITCFKLSKIRNWILSNLRIRSWNRLVNYLIGWGKLDINCNNLKKSRKIFKIMKPISDSIILFLLISFRDSRGIVSFIHFSFLWTPVFSSVIKTLCFWLCLRILLKLFAFLHLLWPNLLQFLHF